MTTPADELRAAAEKIRALAATATDGPWHQSGIGDEGWTVASPDQFIAETEDGEKGRADADYIAAMGPNVGEKLARWLDVTADSLAANTHPGWQEAVAPDALAVARTLLGGQP
ncbi:hypothetical protein [Streptomyces griseorubiginosus]|uniref:hypothetical protein n=1 Tax=Streptomyces griseorubiginosus TaxID=67304 RepID=UPI00333344D5